MKKIKKILRFSSISIVVFIVLGYLARIIFNLLWKFDLFNAKSYQILQNYWEKGGVFNTFRDCSLGFALFMLPVLWLIISYKVYKKGFWKTILIPVEKLYRKLTSPKNMEVAHVSLKNLGGKDKTLDEIIADKIKSEQGGVSSINTVRDIRREISARIEENEKQ